MMFIISSEQPSDVLIRIIYQDKTHSFLSCFLSVLFLFLLSLFQKNFFEFPDAWLNPPPLTPLPSSASDKAAGCLKLDLPTKDLTCFLSGIVTSNCHIVLLTLSTFEAVYLRQIIYQYKSKSDVLLLFNTQQLTFFINKIS